MVNSAFCVEGEYQIGDPNVEDCEGCTIEASVDGGVTWQPLDGGVVYCVGDYLIRSACPGLWEVDTVPSTIGSGTQIMVPCENLPPDAGSAPRTVKLITEVAGVECVQVAEYHLTPRVALHNPATPLERANLGTVGYAPEIAALPASMDCGVICVEGLPRCGPGFNAEIGACETEYNNPNAHTAIENGNIVAWTNPTVLPTSPPPNPTITWVAGPASCGANSDMYCYHWIPDASKPGGGDWRNVVPIAVPGWKMGLTYNQGLATNIQHYRNNGIALYRCNIWDKSSGNAAATAAGSTLPIPSGPFDEPLDEVLADMTAEGELILIDRHEPEPLGHKLTTGAGGLFPDPDGGTYDHWQEFRDWYDDYMGPALYAIPECRRHLVMISPTNEPERMPDEDIARIQRWAAFIDMAFDWMRNHPVYPFTGIMVANAAGFGNDVPGDSDHDTYMSWLVQYMPAWIAAYGAVGLDVHIYSLWAASNFPAENPVPGEALDIDTDTVEIRNEHMLALEALCCAHIVGEFGSIETPSIPSWLTVGGTNQYALYGGNDPQNEDLLIYADGRNFKYMAHPGWANNIQAADYEATLLLGTWLDPNHGTPINGSWFLCHWHGGKLTSYLGYWDHPNAGGKDSAGKLGRPAGNPNNYTYPLVMDTTDADGNVTAPVLVDMNDQYIWLGNADRNRTHPYVGLSPFGEVHYQYWRRCTGDGGAWGVDARTSYVDLNHIYWHLCRYLSSEYYQPRPGPSGVPINHASSYFIEIPLSVQPDSANRFSLDATHLSVPGEQYAYDWYRSTATATTGFDGIVFNKWEDPINGVPAGFSLATPPQTVTTATLTGAGGSTEVRRVLVDPIVWTGARERWLLRVRNLTTGIETFVPYPATIDRK